jgi:hypothetical protein
MRKVADRKPVSHLAGMKRPVRPASASSTVSVKNQTRIPREIVLDAAEADDPFAAFCEWQSIADERAYRDL